MESENPQTLVAELYRLIVLKEKSEPGHDPEQLEPEDYKWHISALYSVTIGVLATSKSGTLS